MVEDKQIRATGDSIEEARAKIREQVPEGMSVISEKVLSDGRSIPSIVPLLVACARLLHRRDLGCGDLGTRCYTEPGSYRRTYQKSRA